MNTLRIGGLTPLTTVDYPDHLAAVLFCQGCPWRCGYCHNAHLQPLRADEEARWPWRRVMGFLEDRVGLLEAVVFSGGEPTLQPALGDAMRAVKALGYKIGLHTAGIFPARLRQVLPLVDWVGLDIKAPLDDRYDRVTGRSGSAPLASEALDVVLAAGVACQLRTTVAPALLCDEDCAALTRTLRRRGAPDPVWQEFRAHPGQ